MSWYALPVTGRAHSFERSPVVSDCGLVAGESARQALLPSELRDETVATRLCDARVSVPSSCCGLCRRAVRARARRRTLEAARTV